MGVGITVRFGTSWMQNFRVPSAENLVEDVLFRAWSRSKYSVVYRRLRPFNFPVFSSSTSFSKNTSDIMSLTNLFKDLGW